MMDIKSPKTNRAGGLIERTSSILDEIESKKNMIDRGKRSKTLSEKNPVENINKTPRSFLEIFPVQK